MVLCQVLPIEGQEVFVKIWEAPSKTTWERNKMKVVIKTRHLSVITNQATECLSMVTIIVRLRESLP